MRSYVFPTAFGVLVLATFFMASTEVRARWHPPMLYPAPPVQDSQSSSTDSHQPSKTPYGKAHEQANESHDLHPAPRPQRVNKAPAEKTIWLYDDFFAPDVVLVSVGGTVLWENKGLHSHTVTSDDEIFDSGRLDRNDSYRFTFERAGTYHYHCRIHGKEMSGTVTVK